MGYAKFLRHLYTFILRDCCVYGRLSNSGRECHTITVQRAAVAMVLFCCVPPGVHAIEWCAIDCGLFVIVIKLVGIVGNRR